MLLCSIKKISMIHKRQIIDSSHWYSPIIIRYLVYVISIFLLFFISEARAFNNVSANLYIISDQSFVGDRNQLLGVAREAKEYFKSKSVTINTQEYDISDLNSLEEKIKNTNDLSILVTVGYYGINSILKLKHDKEIAKKIIAVHLSHKLLNNGELSHQQLIQTKSTDSFGADIVVLPKHVVDNDARKKLTGVKTILLAITGVPHNLQVSDIDADYNKYKSQIPVNEKYLVVILAGDVPDENNKYKCYTIKETEKLAAYVSDIALKNNYFVLLTNGPRTGKYDCQTQNKKDVHNKDSTLDPVTSRFQQILTEKNVPSKLFDFKFNQPNMYKALLGAVLYGNHSLVMVPGESTSMVSEITDTVNSRNIIVYYTSVMISDHMQHVQQAFDNGHISVLDQDMRLQLNSPTKSAPTTSTKDIAKAIYNAWQQSATNQSSKSK